jgi:hypothetical protein
MPSLVVTESPLISAVIGTGAAGAAAGQTIAADASAQASTQSRSRDAVRGAVAKIPLTRISRPPRASCHSRRRPHRKTLRKPPKYSYSRSPARRRISRSRRPTRRRRGAGSSTASTGPGRSAARHRPWPSSTSPSDVSQTKHVTLCEARSEATAVAAASSRPQTAQCAAAMRTCRLEAGAPIATRDRQPRTRPQWNLGLAQRRLPSLAGVTPPPPR